MSYADPTSERPGRARHVTGSRTAPPRVPRGGTTARPSAPPDEDAEPTVERARGSSYRRSVDWERVGALSVGLLVGALVGAGAALLFAPRSGHDTRLAIGRGARLARLRASDAWDDFTDEVTAATRRGRRRARRALRRAQWRARDAIA